MDSEVQTPLFFFHLQQVLPEAQPIGAETHLSRAFLISSATARAFSFESACDI
jgi:hypothetical protein